MKAFSAYETYLVEKELRFFSSDGLSELLADLELTARVTCTFQVNNFSFRHALAAQPEMKFSIL